MKLIFVDWPLATPLLGQPDVCWMGNLAALSNLFDPRILVQNGGGANSA